MEVITDSIYTLISIIAAFYALSVWRWMRARVRAARPVGNGRLELAKGAAASAGRKLWVCAISVLIGLLVGLRDALTLINDPEPFSLTALGLRLLFIAMILLVMDSLRLQKVTYVRSEKPR